MSSMYSFYRDGKLPSEHRTLELFFERIVQNQPKMAAFAPNFYLAHGECDGFWVRAKKNQLQGIEIEVKCSKADFHKEFRDHSKKDKHQAYNQLYTTGSTPLQLYGGARMSVQEFPAFYNVVLYGGKDWDHNLIPEYAGIYYVEEEFHEDSLGRKNRYTRIVKTRDASPLHKEAVSPKKLAEVTRSLSYRTMNKTPVDRQEDDYVI